MDINYNLPQCIYGYVHNNILTQPFFFNGALKDME